MPESRKTTSRLTSSAAELVSKLYAEPQNGVELRSSLAALNFHDQQKALRNLKVIVHTAQKGGETEASKLLPDILVTLSASPDPDMGLNNFERFVVQLDDPKPFFNELKASPSLRNGALRLFASSQSFSDIIIDVGSLDGIRPRRKEKPKDYRSRLCEELTTAVHQAASHEDKLTALRKSKHQEIVRIGWDDVLNDRNIEDVTHRISILAEAELEAALLVAVNKARSDFKIPDDVPIPAICVIGLGKLGGEELNYSSDIDVFFVCAEEGTLPVKYRGGALTFEILMNSIATSLVSILSQITGAGYVFRVDTRLRPEGGTGKLVRTLVSFLNYYDNYGSTWERQALVKARPVAGDLKLGQKLLDGLQPFVYPKYLDYDAISEIKHLKGRIERRAQSNHGTTTTIDVKLGPGGIRDVEYVVQFLQLLHGGEHPHVRHHNTLEALRLLEDHGCLPPADASELDRAYRFLRRTEHRLMILYQFQVHQLPKNRKALARLARRMGFAGKDQSAIQSFTAELSLHRKAVRSIFSQLFSGYLKSEQPESAPEVDLILEPDPSPDLITTVLGRYGFTDPQKAYLNLSALARESTPLLATPRTRTLMAQITPRLLQQIAKGPDPDMALNNLERCVDSLGAKTVFYELLAENANSIELFVDLCSWSQFLSDILIRNPGMLDQLVDSLVVGGHKTMPQMERELQILLSGASDPVPILHSYKNGELLRIGLRDILGSTDIEETMRNLSNLAEAVVRSVCQICEAQLIDQYGTPQVTYGQRGVARAEFAVIALGKLGGAEINYSSDLDVIFVYSRDGKTTEGTSNKAFFTSLAKQVLRMLGGVTVYGQLYRVDPRLRPDGSKGMLVSSFRGLKKYYGERRAQLWERQALTRARLVAGDGSFGQEVTRYLAHCTYKAGLSDDELREISDMRITLQKAAKPGDIKRGPGGILDIEFAVQATQLAHGTNLPSLRTPNTAEALRNICVHNLLPPGTAQDLLNSYRFLRLVESRLRIVTDQPTQQLPTDTMRLSRLARRVGATSGPPEAQAATFLSRCQSQFDTIRTISGTILNLPPPARG